MRIENAGSIVINVNVFLIYEIIIWHVYAYPRHLFCSWLSVAVRRVRLTS